MKLLLSGARKLLSEPDFAALFDRHAAAQAYSS